MAKKDNGSLQLKAEIRLKTLEAVVDPVIMETHGGWGELFLRCYWGLKGIAFETDEEKARFLARQRPCWAIYECDAARALSMGIGAHLDVNFVDVDPYGNPWPFVDAFFVGERPKPYRLWMVVNDGLRQNLKMNRGWKVKSLASIVEKYGNTEIYKKYLSICEEMMQKKGAQAGYSLSSFTGYYCGYARQMTHYAASFTR